MHPAPAPPPQKHQPKCWCLPTASSIMHIHAHTHLYHHHCYHLVGIKYMAALGMCHVDHAHAQLQETGITPHKLCYASCHGQGWAVIIVQMASKSAAYAWAGAILGAGIFSKQNTLPLLVYRMRRSSLTYVISQVPWLPNSCSTLS